MKHAVVALCALVIAPNALAAGPEAHPSCHCKPRVGHAYTWKRVWRQDGIRFVQTCRVGKRTVCSISFSF